MRGWRGPGVAVVLAAATLGPACSSDDGDCMAPSPDELVAERPVAMPSEGPAIDVDAFAGTTSPMLVVQLSNSEPRPERVWARLDGEAALDVDLPPRTTDPDCRSDGTVFTFAVPVPAGPLTIEVGLSGATVDREVTIPDDGPLWVVVQPFGDPATSPISVFAEQPQWG